MTATLETAVTFGQIVKRVGAEREHHVRDSIRRLQIEPLRRAGAAYLYPPEAVDAVREDLQRRHRPNASA